ncbi:MULTISPECIES: alpha-ketoglutarate-dependent dioxygenase AlkB family protein [Pseudoalteromonas]|uniref:2OG-Fe(II) oxygenase n=1 Tax=Pseudoalteromonas amylolytica TaxID=1859457 RepID=A0A1S1MW94_9GAMM|nr:MULTISPECIES: alpha-ketoglutarate-dependent dioxygenase AlkB [Pseudoalteromonas]OHU89110.1 2OG-Fe(II) oxygenase [Pseudoalteromonas sp. JW3]OHU92011.1 2OG-Fe(II) oxygenase [Pseudoalteromonas amylolytica]
MTLSQPEQLLPSGFDYHPAVISLDKSIALYDYLCEQLIWQQPRIQVFGKYHTIPRKQCFIADDDVVYSYSKQTLNNSPWPAPLLAMRHRLQRTYGFDFNALLVNWYRDGQDKMGWHSDDEAELGQEPCIVSISLGASRKFKIKHKVTGQQYELLLQSGSVLVMHGDSQQLYQHALPAQAKVSGGRINLTFRTVGQALTKAYSNGRK